MMFSHIFISDCDTPKCYYAINFKLMVTDMVKYSKTLWSQLYHAALEAECNGDYYHALILWNQAQWVANLSINKRYAEAKSEACKMKLYGKVINIS